MKKCSVFLLVCLLMALLLPVSAQADGADTLALPSAMKTIGDEAFRNDASIQTVVLPEGVTTIGSCAFAGSGVTKINLPASITSIADNAFADCSSSLTAFVVSDSYAARWCDDHGITTVLLITLGNTTVDITTGGQRVRLCFVPSKTGSYTLKSTGSYDTMGYLFDASGTQLAYNDDISNGDRNFSINYRLTAGSVYYYEVRFYDSTLTGSIDLVLSGMPIQIQTITLGTTTATISTGGQILEYRFTPPRTGSYTLKSTGSYDTMGYLFDASGTQLAYNDDISDGDRNFLISHTLTAGREYTFSVKFYSGSLTGSFPLVLSADFAPVITQQPASVDVTAGSTATFSVAATGTGTLSYRWQELLPNSSTWQNTTLGGNRTDTLSFTAQTTHNGRSFRCVVTDVDGFSTTSNEVSLSVWEPGAKPVYRALLVGNDAYTSANPLNGCVNDMNAMAAMLSGLANSFSCTTLPNATVAQMRSAIGAAFSGATGNDVSLFYYSGHGVGTSSETSDLHGALLGIDSSYFYPRDLASALSQVPGRVIVLLDSCHSGAAIGKNEVDEKAAIEAFNQGVIDAFAEYDTTIVLTEGAANAKYGELATSKFVVITACKASELSQIGPSSGQSVFTYCLIKGCGCNYGSGSYTGSMPADTDGNNRLTVSELYIYTRDLASYYNSGQTAQYYASSDAIELFRR